MCRGPAPGSEAQDPHETPGTWPVPLREHFRSYGEDSPSKPGEGSQSQAGQGPLPGAGMEDAAQPSGLPILQQGKPALGWRAAMTDDRDEPLIHSTHTPHPPGTSRFLMREVMRFLFSFKAGLSQSFCPYS